MGSFKTALLFLLASWGLGNFFGYTLTRDEVRKAMCSYYSDWEFCKGIEIQKNKDFAIMGLSEKVHSLEWKVQNLEKKVSEKDVEELCVKAYRLNIRLYPEDGRVIGIYKRGAKVKVLDKIGNWIRTEDGWVSSKFLEECQKVVGG